MLTKLCTTITIFCAAMILSFKTNAQSTESLTVYDHRWTYSFTIEGVQDHDQAKFPAAIIHKTFKVFPLFNANNNRYSFECKLDKSLIEFNAIFEDYDFVISNWTKVYTGKSSADENSQEQEKDQ
jgi:hypothetical protein